MANLARLLAISFVLLPCLARAASFTPLGLGASGIPPESYATAVSDDGAVVVGQTFSQAFRWSGGVMTEFGNVFAADVSADGSVVVGHSFDGPRAFRLSGGVMTFLPLLPGDNGNTAAGVSADGQVIVGNPYDSAGASTTEAFRWENGAMSRLGLLPNTTHTGAADVSDDGEVVVGTAGTSTTGVAFRWESGVMSSLGGFPDGTLESRASAVSADGAFVVGSMSTATGDEAFRWTGGEILGLGHLSDLTNDYSQAHGVSADGAIVVGASTAPDGGYDAFIWTASDGMQRLIDVLVANGATGLEGWDLVFATGVSADGRWIVGSGTNPDGSTEAFLADISPVPGPHASWLLGFALAALVCVRR